jgi:hypothetical protein
MQKQKRSLKKKKAITCLNLEAAKAFQKNIWLTDSAASTDFVSDEIGLTSVRMMQSTVKIGNRKVLNATKVGDLPVRCLSKDNEDQTFFCKTLNMFPN